MAISALIIGLATLSFSLFARDWIGRTSGFVHTSAELQRLDLLVGSLEASIPWRVKAPSSKTGFGYYFLGREEGFTFVSSDPVFGAGAPAVARVFRETDRDGRYRLVYEEASLAGITLSNADQVLPFRNRMIVLSGLRKLEFRYFGWLSALARASAEDAPSAGQAWFSSFDGLERNDNPIRIALTVDDARAVFALAEHKEVTPE